MPAPPPRLDPVAVGDVVGSAAFRRAQGYQRAGMVRTWRWDADACVLTARVAGSGPQPYTCRVSFTVGTDGRYAYGSSTCSCPVRADCKHVAAVLLHVGAQPGAADAGKFDDGGGDGAPEGWRGRLAAVTGVSGARTADADEVAARGGGVLPVALRFRLDEAFGDLPTQLSVRPVVRGRTGWKVAPEASWEALATGLYAFADVRATPAPEVRRWFADLGSALADGGGFGRARQAWRPLAAGGRGLWALLAEASDLEIPLVAHGARDEVRLARVAEARLVVGAAGDGVRLDPVLAFDGADAPAGAALGAVGDTGLFAADTQDRRTVLRVGPTPRRLGDAARELVVVGRVDVPAADVAELFADHLPVLRRAVRVVSSGSVELPDPPRPVLVAEVGFVSPEHARLAWTFEYSPPDGAVRRVPLDGATSEPVRDPDAEAEIRDKAQAAVRGVAGFERFDLVARTELRGLDALDLAHAVLPALAATGDVRVAATDVPHYLHLDAAPRVVVSGAPSGDSDWLDLGISVTVAGKELPFTRLFTALARGDERLLLVDGSWLRLDQPVLGRLRDLITEATALSDRPGKARVSRYDAHLWGELEDLADVVEAAAAWRRALAGLRSLAAGGSAPEPAAVPDGVRAVLRPYQREAFEWLTFLWDHGLGGILADDMGLGKTVETLTFLAHARTQAPGSPPFVVVAPASVVGNWVDEAARFTPDLRVVAMPATARTLGTEVADLAAEADVVVTSYAVFRLEFDAFDALDWGGLILDEAQVAKNPRTRAHETARLLGAPFKLAITGTPLENNLMELWAVLAIVAPGLYPSMHRFKAETARVVDAAAADDDPQVVAAGNRALARLKRRIRPLVLRRTKEQVAPELPERTERVLRVPLTPDHRKVYDTHLQRERQRLLGLLEDFDANRVAIFRSLTTLRRLALDASLLDDAYAHVGSAKLDVVTDELTEIAAEGHRALVFSQFTSFLRRVEERCAAAGLPVVYLDGATRRRADVVRSFRDGDAPVFLISLKAGGVGLNLTEADYVYLLDPWWNPAAEAQAVDRTHRIGQTRNVVVTRLVAQDTIEEKVMALARRKAALFDAVLDDAAGTFARALAADDVRGLLDG
ncbi:DEAD/DEAH box helicase [Krasilnikoviella flava]|uniref:Superfamily II DNA or RNA helicase, SNF2 family n=1 Tax=Krasilnikoviella flava TaxID=526729 RepID=A0A1T5LVK4_9MICO|nr:DEAD/DEAH box helicase [Krasilnikoviella flava]SKC79599.1 Superfamily II DNA or RNA helicase, SNF2 family [Krasilnikoviella flava]